MRGARVRLKPYAKVRVRGTGRPARPSGCVIGTIVANGTRNAKPRGLNFLVQRTANRTPAASSLERDFLLLTCLIAGATWLVYASPRARFEQQRKHRRIHSRKTLKLSALAVTGE